MDRKIKSAVANPRSVSSIDRHIGERIRARRLELDLSQEQLAAAIGVTFQQVQKYERGFNRVSAATLFRICKVLDLNIEAFLPKSEGGARATAQSAVSEELSLIVGRLNSEQRKSLMDYAKKLAGPERRRAKKQ